MRVLGISSYPVTAAATRFRMEQFVGPLAERGIELTISPFLDAEQFGRLYSTGGVIGKSLGVIGPLMHRVSETFRLGRYDLLFVQREAMPFGPGVFEWLFQKAGRLPMVLDLDDATYIRYVSPSFGRVGSYLKFFGKTDKLIERAATVVCGNRYIAEYVEAKGTPAVVVPTVVDTDKFCPVERRNDIPVLGWIGTHSTYPFLEWLAPVFARLAEKHQFRVKVVGAGKAVFEGDGYEVVGLDWELDREIADFQSLDIGLYPLKETASFDVNWLRGKSGFKAIQYMAVGVPFITTPIGVTGEIGEVGKTHLNATTLDDWYNQLDKLLADAELRREMGAAGRRFSLDNYTVARQVPILAEALTNAAHP